MECLFCVLRVEGIEEGGWSKVENRVIILI